MDDEAAAWEDMHSILESQRLGDESAKEAKRCEVEAQSGVHICPGPQCPYIESERTTLNKDCTYICARSGVCYGQLLSSYEWAATLRPAGCGGDSEQASFISSRPAKRDPVRASLAAYMSARSFDDDSYRTPRIKATHAAVSCRAPVVVTRSKKKLRRVDVLGGSGTRASALLQQASSIVDRIIRVSSDAHKRDVHAQPTLASRAASVSSNARVCAVASGQGGRCSDVVSRRFVVDAKRYVKKCQSVNDIPCIHELHNMCLMDMYSDADTSVRVSVNTECILRGTWYLRIRDLLCRLIVILWAAVSKSSYMHTRRRACDNFNQFAVGVVYGMRRGIQTKGGHVLVPHCPYLCNALPSMRTPLEKKDGPTKFRMSAHRGLSTLQRSLAGVMANGESLLDGQHGWHQAIQAAAALRTEHNKLFEHHLDGIS